MLVFDVNVLVYAHKEGTARHDEFRDWLTGVLQAPAAFGVSELVLSGFIRVVTHPRVFDPPSSLETAIEFAEVVRSRPNAVRVAPGPRHWEVFRRLCVEAGVRGSLVADAYLAALAIESGSEWITTDRDYARFSGLRWRHPLDG
jgi:toxin-antitoxin system PIN domain toxin